jgi:hypothetical protein
MVHLLHMHFHGKSYYVGSSAHRMHFHGNRQLFAFQLLVFLLYMYLVASLNNNKGTILHTVQICQFQIIIVSFIVLITFKFVHNIRN